MNAFDENNSAGTPKEDEGGREAAFQEARIRRVSEAALRDLKGVYSARQLAARSNTRVTPHWHLANLGGRLVEVRSSEGAGALTLLTWLILQAQRASTPTAWIAAGQSTFYPPDLAAAGVDLEALPVITLPDPVQAASAADTLLRSDGFGLVVLDLSEGGRIPVAVQTRLAGLARRHQTALVCLTGIDRPLAGSLVSLRVQVESARTGFNQFRCTVHVTRDREQHRSWNESEVHRGPDGLC